LGVSTRPADRKRKHVSVALAAVAVLLGASAFGKVAGFYVQCARVQGTLSLARPDHDPNGLKHCLGAARKAADTLKQNNLFVKMPPEQHPVKQVEGIFGSEVFIGGKWYKVGDKIGNATIVAINATNVKVEWNGKETSFSPIDSTSAQPPGRSPAGGRPGPGAGPPPRPPEGREVETEEPRPAEDDPLAWVGVELSPKLRAMLMEKWSSASPEEREKGQREWHKMSEEQKQQALEKLEQRM
jgi:hypothetical protein